MEKYEGTDLEIYAKTLTKAYRNMSKLLTRKTMVKSNLSRYASICHYYMKYLKIFPKGEHTVEFFNMINDHVSASTSEGNAKSLVYDTEFNHKFRNFVIEKTSKLFDNIENKDEKLEKTLKYINQQNSKNAFFYHCTTEYNANEIKRDGIRAKNKLDNKEISYLFEIAKKYEFEDIFGVWFDSSEGKSYFTNYEQQIFFYADRSPEWFTELTGESGIYSNIINPYFRDSYSMKKRDYVKANIEKVLNFHHVSEKDSETFKNICMDLYDKYSKGDSSSLVIIPEKHFKSELFSSNVDFDFYYEQYIKDDDGVEKLFSMATKDGREADFGTTLEFEPEDFAVAEIKSFMQISNEMQVEKKMTDEISYQ